MTQPDDLARVVAEMRAELAARPDAISTELYGDRYFGGDYSRADLTREQDAYIAACSPANVSLLLDALPVWISVKDRMPPRHRHVWCLNRNGWQFEGCICYGMHEPFFTYPRGDGNASNTAPAWIDVTHWMPLPAIATTKGQAT